MSLSDIVIVGAGAAGITAARSLQDHCRVTVLEARSRVGGRAWTDKAAFGLPIDMGAAWLHSANLNSWTGYARRHGFSILPRSPEWQRRIGARVASNEFLEAWLEAREYNDNMIRTTALAHIDVAIAAVIPQDSFRPLFDAVMSWLMGAESTHISTVDYERYKDTARNWAVHEGLGSVVAHAAEGLDIRLDTPVHSIDWSGARVRVGTARGALDADAVLVTVPTNVLADESAIRFTPGLPKAHLDALHGIPLGIANKVFFELEPGAMPYEGSVNFVGTDNTSRTASYQTRPAGQEALLAYFGGELALELERRNELETFARDELANIFGAKFPGRIRRACHSAWATDPWSRGAYSAALPGKGKLRARLSEPLGERVFFAGEACSLDYFGTLNGAWESAIQAVNRMLGRQERRVARS
jgi:monoamine oxidase